MTAAASLTSAPLAGRVALVTGLSRPAGIAMAVARRLHELGAVVHATGWPPHDASMAWGAADVGDLPFPVARHDLEDPEAPARVVDEVVGARGRLDIVAAVHARSSEAGFDDVDAAELDRCWAANVRSIVLLAQRFAAVHDPAPADGPPTGRMLWCTSGQHRAPMDLEIAYAVSKGALHQMTLSVDRALSRSGIVANCINPGPVDTGWAAPEIHEAVAERFPDGRWTSPAQIADLVGFLVSDAGAVIRGQVIDAESGFRR